MTYLLLDINNEAIILSEQFVNKSNILKTFFNKNSSKAFNFPLS